MRTRTRTTHSPMRTKEGDKRWRWRYAERTFGRTPADATTLTTLTTLTRRMPAVTSAPMPFGAAASGLQPYTQMMYCPLPPLPCFARLRRMATTAVTTVAAEAVRRRSGCS